MKPLSFKVTSDHFRLCVFLSLLWVVTDSNATPTPPSTPASTPAQTSTPSTTLTTTVTSTTEATTTAAPPTTTTTTPATTQPPPDNVKDVQVLSQNENSITLVWDKVDNILTYFLKYDNEGLKVVPIIALEAGPSVTHVVSSLTAGIEYNFTLFTSSEGGNSTGYKFQAVTAPLNAEDFQSVDQTDTSVTLQWKKVGNFNYILVLNEEETNITASEGSEPERHTISGLTSGTRHEFTLYTVFKDARSSGVPTTAFTIPLNANGFKSVNQSEISITLQWEKVNNVPNYRLVFNGQTINIPASEADPVTYVVSDLTNTTRYNFTLFTVFENVTSRGVNIIAFTAPPDAEGFESVEQSETNITLQWKSVNDFVNYTLVYFGKEINISASTEEEPIKYTVPELTSGTKYDFTLYSVFETVRSSGVKHSAPTAPKNVPDVNLLTQNENSITLVWDKVNDNSTYLLQYHKEGHLEVDTILAPEGGSSVTHVVSSLTAGTIYHFTLITQFEGVNSTGYRFDAVTAPLNAKQFKAVRQNEISITLQWEKVNGVLNYTLEFNETMINITVSEEDPMTYTVLDLESMRRYVFTLFAVFENARSSGINTIAFTAPRNTEKFESVEQNETSITLQWKQVNEVLSYTLMFNKMEINVAASAGLQVKHTVTELKSGTKYHFTLYSLFETVRSSGVNYSAPTAPANVNNVTVVTQNESSITLKWDKVNDISTYFLQYDNNGSFIEVNQEASVTYEVSSLNAGTKYNFTLITRFEKVNSTGFSFCAVTVPSVVPLVNVTERSVTSINLTWQNVNKDWNYFLLIDGGITQSLRGPDSDVVSRSVTSLQPGTAYPFSVITEFSGHNSTAYKGFTVTKIDCANVSWRVTNSSIQGVVEGLFSNATVTNQSQIHVSPGGSNVTFTDLYPGATYNMSLVYEKDSISFSQCNHTLTIMPPMLSAHCKYWAAGYSILIVWNEPEGVWTDVEVNVMGDSHIVADNGQRQLTIPGFLPARTYEVSLTSLSGLERSYEPFVFQCSTDPRGVIAGSVFAVLLFAILVCLAVFIFLKRPDIISRKKSFIGGSRQADKKCKAISVAKFPDHFAQLSADENRGFTQEYDSLAPVGTEQTRKAAGLPENKTRNRFNNVQPYDWCRVKLTSSSHNETSDYINASYMPGYNSNREFIATQGPLPATVDDFWRMIWEQRVKGIVMVTNCTENGRIKCEQYWPADSQPCPYGELLVTVSSEQQEPNWTLREFRLKQRNTSEERTVKHFHFTAWPDHGVPQGTEVLIQFRGLVRQHIESTGTGAPTVVHCSAGVGRTGTIIALDVLLQQLAKQRAVGIKGFVYKMRLSRPYMVQTESQYVFLHQCIMDSLQPREKTEENIYENADMIYANATALREFHNANA